MRLSHFTVHCSSLYGGLTLLKFSVKRHHPTKKRKGTYRKTLNNRLDFVHQEHKATRLAKTSSELPGATNLFEASQVYLGALTHKIHVCHFCRSVRVV